MEVFLGLLGVPDELGDQGPQWVRTVVTWLGSPLSDELAGPGRQAFAARRAGLPGPRTVRPRPARRAPRVRLRPHYCAGAPLARIKVRAALTTLLATCPGVRLDADARLDFSYRARGFVQHGTDALLVLLRP
jgi:cytochrome P450